MPAPGGKVAWGNAIALRWAIAGAAFALAFDVFGMLPSAKDTDTQVAGLFGIWSWGRATAIGSIVGVLAAPPTRRAAARLIFLGLPVAVPTGFLLYAVATQTLRPIDMSSAAQSAIGALGAWVFLRSFKDPLASATTAGNPPNLPSPPARSRPP